MLARDAARARAESALARDLESASRGRPGARPFTRALAYSCAVGRRAPLAWLLTSRHGLASLPSNTATSPPLPRTAID